MHPHVYLDWNATAPVSAGVAAAIAEALAECGNASSVHGAGRRARARIETARARVAALVGARAAQVVFTGSGTEANNLALTGTGRTVLVSAVEHVSVRAAAGGEAMVLPVEAQGRVDQWALERALASSAQPAVVAVMLANNETGVINDVSAVARTAHRFGALVHCDAVQAAGRIPVDMTTLGADLLSLSAHKLGGPQGVGALVLADHVDVTALVRGGGQERGRRAGTEPVALIHGFGLAAEAAGNTLAGAPAVGTLRDRLERAIRALAPAAVVFGADAPRVPNTSCLAMPGVSAATQVMNFDLAGIAVSAGAACSSGRIAASPVLAAMGVPADLAACAIRVSLGPGTTGSDIDRFVEVWGSLWARLGAGRPAASAA